VKTVGTKSSVAITGRKRAEEALRESEAAYRGLVENATYGICSVTLSGKLVRVNPALVQMLGYDSAEDLLSVPGSTVPYRNPSVTKKIVAECVRNGKVDATVDWKRKDGAIVTVRMNGRLVKHAVAQEERLEVIIEDVTQRLALEKQLIEAKKFEAIGQLAGGIAHDFNNMIAAIIGWTDMGVEEAQTGSRTRIRFEKIRNQAERAAALTRQLLAFARCQILEPRHVDLNLSVTDTLDSLEDVIASNILIKATLAPDLAPVLADSTQLNQVLLNLCINARDAMPQGGSLIVETRPITFDEKYCSLHALSRPGHYSMLSVTDTGTGMDAATQERIFEPFFTTKELGKGTGLGLATVYGIVTQHQGFVHVYSELKMGSTFRIYLPATAMPGKSLPPLEDSQQIRGGSETILVAEDHEGLRELARETLSNLGYKVLLAADGQEAVLLFRGNSDRTHLMLLDVMLPKLSGLEVFSQIRAEKPEIPVIFATGHSSDIPLLHAVQQQGLPILQKPYSPRDLGRKVREMLDLRVANLSHH
jgi:two-component system cell cycle sensor histidine kinase/response regulator CckA